MSEVYQLLEVVKEHITNADDAFSYFEEKKSPEGIAFKNLLLAVDGLQKIVTVLERRVS